MTVIAYRDGLLAADSRVCNNEGVITGSVVKLARREDGAIAGLCGHAGDVAMFRAWFLAGNPRPWSHPTWEAKDKGQGFAALVIELDGTVQIVDEHGVAYPLEAEFYARGAGAELALGAMEMGARADQAVEVACRRSVWCGGEIRTLSLEGVPQLARALSAV
jgi:hypothetical protein